MLKTLLWKMSTSRYKRNIASIVKLNGEGNYFIKYSVDNYFASATFFCLQFHCLETGSTVGLSVENKMCFLPLVTLLFLQCFSCCGTLVDFCPRGRGQRCSSSLDKFPGDWEWTGFWPGSFILEEIRNQCDIALLIQKE